MKLHLCHFTPHGLVRAWCQCVAGRRLCRASGMRFRPLVPESINSMTAAWNVWRVFREAGLEAPGTLLDVGANRSQMARMLLSLNREARVFSFEPNPDLTPLGTVFHMALSDADGDSDFWIPSNDTGWGTLEASNPEITAGTPHFTVQTRRMDSLVADGTLDWAALRKPIFLKLDVEGAEMRVLKGFGALLKDVSYVLMEVDNGDDRGGEYDLLSLCSLMRSAGFSRSRIVYACYDGPDAPTYCDMLFWH